VKRPPGLAVGLRPAEPRDLEACARIYVAAAEVAFPWLPPAARGADGFWSSIPDEEISVAEGPNGVLGFVSVYLPDRFLHSLYVDPRAHRRGIGRALLSLALRRCGGHAHLKCLEANRPACLFYTLNGWQPAGWGWDSAGPWIRFFY
jgi:GNAT superfamily N-acetyltransferase